jgi:hypothetical protein
VTEQTPAAAATRTRPADADAATVTAFGYQPVLHRTMGKFSVFAISFSLISLSTGLFATTVSAWTRRVRGSSGRGSSSASAS